MDFIFWALENCFLFFVFFTNRLHKKKASIIYFGIFFLLLEAIEREKKEKDRFYEIEIEA